MGAARVSAWVVVWKSSSRYLRVMVRLRRPWMTEPVGDAVRESGEGAAKTLHLGSVGVESVLLSGGRAVSVPVDK
jgi:hypothetical protein